MSLHQQVPLPWQSYCECSPLTWDLIEQGIMASEQVTEVFPAASLRFNALSHVKPEEVKVVILGQDPYPTPGDAHGLSFSSQGTRTPKSLQNIFKELEADCGILRKNADLTSWARQGVLLLNTYLTVEKKNPGSHAKIGWEEVTDSLISQLSQRHSHIVFLLWGAASRKKKTLIDTTKHLILESAHPSPLSAHAGFFGNHHFSKTNAYLEEKGRGVITW